MMEGLLATPGFRFHPTDEELFMYHLKRKVMGKSFRYEMISEVDVYKFAPWDLPAMSRLKTRDLNWFFFCPRAKKYPNGGRSNRATGCGYWKSTGNDRTVNYNSRPVGKIKTLVFHLGKAPKGDRTDWVMHEYRLEDKELVEKGVPQDAYVICKIYKKSGLGPKNGESYGARFVEEEWDTDVDDDTVQERGRSGTCDVGGDRVGDSPDGADSAVTGVGTPVGIPIVSDAVVNVGSSNIATGLMRPSLGTPNATLGSSTVAVASASEQAELDRLLAYLTAENVEDVGDIYSGLGDLSDPSVQRDIHWSELNCDHFIELDDLR